MATAENIAIERRVEALESSIQNQAGLYVRVTFVVVGRGYEPDYLTLEEVLEAVEREPEVVELRRIEGPELLIDPIARTRKLRHKLSEVGKAKFDQLKAQPGVRLVDVQIRCHEGQLKAIRSKTPITAAFGGNRSGKSMVLVYWLFLRWMYRGGPPKNGLPRIFWWVSPDTTKMIEQGVWVIAGQEGLGGGVWPDELFAQLTPCPLSKKNPTLEMVDGSIIAFKHAAHQGAQAGKNLKSANIVGAVVDELGVIKGQSNWHQVLIRVSQTGGHVATSTTRVTNHWSHKEISERAEIVGPEVIDVSTFTIFENPWMSWAAIWQLFVADKTITPKQLETNVLRAEDKAMACLALVTNPDSLREHFGVETSTDPKMWTEWKDEFIYHDAQILHPEIFVTGAEGQAKRLINITTPMLAGHSQWGRAHQLGHRFNCWAGLDPNVRGHAVTLELFGEGRSVPEALANRASWTVLVNREIESEGSTLALANKLKSVAGIVPIWYDPAGETGHAARGTAGSSDATILRQVGHFAAPAYGENAKGHTITNLRQQDTRGVMHWLMANGRFRVHERCTGLIEAMNSELRLSDGSGRVNKRSNPNSHEDWLSGFSDSARYALWVLFSKEFQDTGIAKPPMKTS
jgi:hypothetical protein